MIFVVITLFFILSLTAVLTICNTVIKRQTRSINILKIICKSYELINEYDNQEIRHKKLSHIKQLEDAYINNSGDTEFKLIRYSLDT